MPELVRLAGSGVASPPTTAQKSKTYPSDAALMKAVAAGDRGAFEQVYEDHRSRAYRLAYGVLLDRDEAREAVQEAFLKLHLNASRWEPQAALGTWLHRVVLNHCLSLRRRIFRFASREARPSRSPSPENIASQGQVLEIVESVLAELAPRKRAVVTLFLGEELRPSEIAPLVGLSPNATRVTLHRALERLRAELTAHGIDAAEENDPALELEEDP